MTVIQGKDTTYTLEKALGEGTYGITYKAEDEHGNKYAIKEFKATGDPRKNRKLEEGILKLITSICDRYCTWLFSTGTHLLCPSYTGFSHAGLGN